MPHRHRLKTDAIELPSRPQQDTNCYEAPDYSGDQKYETSVILVNEKSRCLDLKKRLT
jgi:hypothetical protein